MKTILLLLILFKCSISFAFDVCVTLRTITSTQEQIRCAQEMVQRQIQKADPSLHPLHFSALRAINNIAADLKSNKITEDEAKYYWHYVIGELAMEIEAYPRLFDDPTIHASNEPPVFYPISLRRNQQKAPSLLKRFM